MAKTEYKNGIVELIKGLLESGKIELEQYDTADISWAKTRKHDYASIEGYYCVGQNKKKEKVFELFMPYSEGTWGKPLSAVAKDKTCQEHAFIKVNGKVMNLDFASIVDLYLYLDNYNMRDRDELQAIAFLNKQYD